LVVPINKHGLVGPVIVVGVSGAVFLTVRVLTIVAPHTFDTETVIVPVVKVEANLASTECPVPVSVINEEDLDHV
jgi:hypothetical protein